MQPILTHITATGIDGATDPRDLLLLQRKYPLAEFGFLLSGNPQESPRFPGAAILHRFEGLGLRLSLHLCGHLAREAARGDFSGAIHACAGHFHLFQRVQLNITGYGDKPAVEDLHVDVPDDIGEVIIQQKDADNARPFKRAAAVTDRLAVLLDASGGRGRGGAVRPIGEAYHTGFAGGLGPDNVAATVALLKGMPGVGRFWVDAESRLRGVNDLLDPDLVNRYLAAATKAA